MRIRIYKFILAWLLLPGHQHHHQMVHYPSALMFAYCFDVPLGGGRKAGRKQRRFKKGQMMMNDNNSKINSINKNGDNLHGDNPQQQQQCDANNNVNGKNNGFFSHVINGGNDRCTNTPSNAPIFTKTEASILLFMNDMMQRIQQILDRIQFVQRTEYLLEKIKFVLLYKPPVGIVSVIVISKLILSGRIFRLYKKKAKKFDEEDGKSSPEGLFQEAADELGSPASKRKKRRRQYRHKGRPWNLDIDDRSYKDYGGIEATRTKLCIASLSDYVSIDDIPSSFEEQTIITNTTKSVSINTTATQKVELLSLIEATRKALSVSCQVNDAREYYVEEMIPLLSSIYNIYHKLENGTAIPPVPPPPSTENDGNVSMRSSSIKPLLGESSSINDSDNNKLATTGPSIDDNNKNNVVAAAAPLESSTLQMLLQISYATLEIRAIDALLRSCRDRILLTLARLVRLEKHWSRRVLIQRWSFILFPFLNKYLSRNSLDDERIRLSLAKAAYETELIRLGRIEQTLLQRPKELSDTLLIKALQYSSNSENRDVKVAQKRKKRPTALWRLPSLSRLSLRFNADGRYKLSLRLYDGRSDQIGSYGATKVLLGETTIDKREAKENSSRDSSGTKDSNYDHDVKPNTLIDDDIDNEQWLMDANEWLSFARREICDIVKDTLEFIVTTTSTNNHNKNATKPSLSSLTQEERDLQLIESWSKEIQLEDKGVGLDFRNEEKEWTAVLRLVEGLASNRRAGEGRIVSFSKWIGLINFFGIPKAVFTIWVAQVIHDKVSPHWADIQRVTRETVTIILGIINKRFWIPLVTIITELLNKNPKLLDSFDLNIEEQTLDHMLKDLGVGDGTEATRKEALAGAAQMYEDYVNQGVIMNLVSGKIVRLMLVQIQQLKAGLLNAMGSIDILVDSNRLNVQLLAAIPALLLVTWGTRVFYRFLVSLRAKDITRPINSIHEEMSEYLEKMQKLLLLSSGATTTTTTTTTTTPIRAALEPETAASDTIARKGTMSKDISIIDEENNDRTDEEVFEQQQSTADTGLVSTSSRNVMTLQPIELGEFILYMHSYLVLLDYTTPPVSNRASDTIHSFMQDLLSATIIRQQHHRQQEQHISVVGETTRVGVDRQVALLRLIQQKHQKISSFFN